MAIIIKLCPEKRAIIGSVVSIVVAPPAEIGANLLKYFTNRGANRSVIISRDMFDNNATVPNSAPLYSVIKILDNE